MAESSRIEWTDATWNPITGCSVVSPGCTNCYAMRLAGTRLKHHPSRAGLTVDTKAGPVWNGQVRFNAEWLDQPLRWKTPRRIFVCAHGDLFHEDVPLDWIVLVYGTAIAAVHLRGHTFQILTKRSARAREVLNSDAFWDLVNDYASAEVMDRVDPLDRRSDDARATLDYYGPENPPPGIWLGVSAEDQPRADERIPDLVATPAAVRFVSLEPLLGPIDLTALDIRGEAEMDALAPCAWTSVIDQWRGTSDTWEEDFLDWFNLSRMPTAADGNIHPTLDLVIVGGENGPRPTHPDWVRLLRDQCAATETAFFFKQWGSWATKHDRDRDDPDWRDTADVAQWPNSRWLNLAGGHGFHGERVVRVQQVGKKSAGRLLDGVEHNAMPGHEP